MNLGHAHKTRFWYLLGVTSTHATFIAKYPLQAHFPERATSMRSCHGVFTDQFIFRTVLTRILNIIKFYKPVSKTSDLKMIFFFPFNNVKFSFLISQLYVECVHGGDSIFEGKSALKCF